MENVRPIAMNLNIMDIFRVDIPADVGAFFKHEHRLPGVKHLTGENGADGVGIGRALMGPLKEGGDGVFRKIQEINGQLKTVMARTGFKSVKEMDASALKFRVF